MKIPNPLRAVLGYKTPFLIFLAFLAFTVYRSLDSAIFRYFTLDEALMAMRSHMIVIAGLEGPATELGNEGFMHPPIYESALAGVFKLLGETELTGRGFGIVCLIFQSLFTLLLVRKMLLKEPGVIKKTGVFVASVLILANPLILQHSMLIDADNTFSTLFLSAFLYFFIRMESLPKSAHLKSRGILAVLLALAFFSKEVTPFFVIFTISVYRLLNRDWKSLCWDFLITFMGAVLAVACAAFFYKLIMNEALPIFFQKQQSFRGGRLTPDFFKRVFKMLPNIAKFPLGWLGAPFVVSAVLSLGLALGRFIKSWRIAPRDFPVFLALVIWVPYFLVKPSIDMMKYQYVTYFFFIAAISTDIAPSFFEEKNPVLLFMRRYVFLGWILLALFFVLFNFYFRLGDPIQQAYRQSHSQFWILFAGPFLLCFTLVVLGSGLFMRKWIASTAFFVCLFFIFPVHLSLQRIQSLANYTTVESWLNYGEKGLKECVQYLKPKIKESTKILARRDVIYYLRHRQGFLTEDSSSSFDMSISRAEALKQFYLSRPYEWIIVDGMTLHLNPSLSQFMKGYVERFYRLENRFGDFMIFKRR